MIAAGKSWAVTVVKPRVSDETWGRLRRTGSRLTGRSGEADPTPEELRVQRLKAMDLTELAQEFGTDKWGAHRYTPHYQRHLEHLRDERFTMLEIGIGGYAHEGRGGASLRMWKYFFRNAKIYGLDIQDKKFVDEPRIRTFRGSQTSPKVLQRIVDRAGDLRVVIDDGSHRPAHIRKTFAYLFPLLPDGAIYAIEDIQTSYWPNWGGSLDRHDPTTSMALVKDLIDGLNHEEFLDEDYEPTYADRNVVAVHCYHNLVIIEKGPNDEGSNKRRANRKYYEALAAADS